MAKPIYAGSYSNRGRGRWRRVFIIFLLLQVAVVGVFLFLKKDKEEPTEETQTNMTFGATDDMLPPPIAPSDPIMDPVSTPESRAIVSDAKAAIDGNQLHDAKAILDKLVATTPDPEAIKLLGEVNIRLLTTSPMQVPGMQRYSIKSGDRLSTIASRFNTTVALIQKMNNISDPNRIQINQSLFVLDSIFTIRVSKSRNQLDLMQNGKLFKRYSVGTGRMGKTPAVEFYIYDKIIEPPWTRPTDNKQIEFGDEENVLGTRWMALKADDHPELTGFGIHGTWERDSIGKQSSAGCVRMLNEDVEELFDLVPRKTTVIISD
ncbi:MAG: L,D-transpeptidase family protein [Pontiellaceae bacterium]|nr:L,D-transpeptidase family protein [Pontiellaceae bacterium]MBN2786257.1 L,D-transpeptidase family protein [Pontiellaceae bacterium]